MKFPDRKEIVMLPKYDDGFDDDEEEDEETDLKFLRSFRSLVTIISSS